MFRIALLNLLRRPVRVLLAVFGVALAGMLFEEEADAGFAADLFRFRGSSGSWIA